MNFDKIGNDDEEIFYAHQVSQYQSNIETGNVLKNDKRNIR